jgi:integrase
VIRFDPGTSAEDAVALAPVIADRARHAVDADAGETVAEYAKRWTEWRDGRGITSANDVLARLVCHVMPLIGTIPVADVQRDDLRRVVSNLDDKVRVGFYRTSDDLRRPFAWKTALNLWSAVRAMFRDACSCKRVDLCVRDDNPAVAIPGPDTGPRKSKVYLWPSEFLALVSCDDVPLKWGRMFAIATYLYARAGEVTVLRWEDIDLERRAHSLKRQSRYRRAHVDEVDLRPARPHRSGVGAALPSDAQGVARTRPSLSRSRTRKAVTFHDLRATGVTWAAVRGDDPLKIKQRAGHRSFSTTEGYIRDAKNLGDSFGQVFAAAVSVSAFRRETEAAEGFGRWFGFRLPEPKKPGSSPRFASRQYRSHSTFC